MNVPASEDGSTQQRDSLLSSVLSLFASSSTLICCALPALLVTLGAGAVLSSLVSAVPQLVWLSEHKLPLFVIAGLMLASTGWLQWRNRTAPCPVEPSLCDACLRTRKTALRVYLFSLVIYFIGAYFALGAPWLN